MANFMPIKTELGLWLREETVCATTRFGWLARANDISYVSGSSARLGWASRASDVWEDSDRGGPGVTKWKSCCSWRGCLQSRSLSRHNADRRDVTGQRGWQLTKDHRCDLVYSALGTTCIVRLRAAIEQHTEAYISSVYQAVLLAQCCIHFQLSLDSMHRYLKTYLFGIWDHGALWLLS